MSQQWYDSTYIVGPILVMICAVIPYFLWYEIGIHFVDGYALLAVIVYALGIFTMIGLAERGPFKY